MNLREEGSKTMSKLPYTEDVAAAAVEVVVLGPRHYHRGLRHAWIGHNIGLQAPSLSMAVGAWVVGDGDGGGGWWVVVTPSDCKHEFSIR